MCSGDVSPDGVDPESVALLADLTTNYISGLVDAAVDVHDILTDGSGVAPPQPPINVKKGFEATKKKITGTSR